MTPLYNLFHLLFLQANLIHARLLTVALLPLCAVIALLLRDLERSYSGRHSWPYEITANPTVVWPSA